MNAKRFRAVQTLCDSPDHDLGWVSWSELPVPRIFWAYVVSEYLGVIDAGSGSFKSTMVKLASKKLRADDSVFLNEIRNLQKSQEEFKKEMTIGWLSIRR